jgi:hypothetical protein
MQTAGRLLNAGARDLGVNLERDVYPVQLAPSARLLAAPRAAVIASA